METPPDIAVNIPTELLPDLAAVIEVGLQRSKISPAARKSLAAWWEAEKEFIQEDINKKSNI